MAELVAPWAEAVLPAFLLAAGLTLGAMIALALGHLLGEAWLETLRPALSVVAHRAPILVPLALPLLLATAYSRPGPPVGAWFDPGLMALRCVATLLLWIAVARVLARGPVQRRVAGGALILLVITGAIAMQDWALSRDSEGAGSLQALALTVESAGAAMALATIMAMRGAMPGEAARTGLERALLSFAMATLWFRFVQYIVAYAADLPPEAAWYLRRSEGIWRRMEGVIALPMLLAAIALALVPQWRRWRLAAVSLLLSVQYVVHLAWVVGPDAALPAAAKSALAEFLMPGIVALVLVVAWSPLWRGTRP